MPADPDIRVIIVDDHELLRGGIRFALLSVTDIAVVGETHSGEHAVELCAEVRPDVVLMDMRLAGAMDGLAAIEAIRQRYPKIQVIAVSSFADPDLVREAFRVGAIGYLVKGVSVKVMIDAIRAAHAGQPTLTPEALEALVQHATPVPQSGPDLTAREQEVLLLVAEGMANAQIAEVLMVSVAAVKYHVGNILSKLHASNRTEAAVLARQYGIVPK